MPNCTKKKNTKGVNQKDQNENLFKYPSLNPVKVQKFFEKKKNHHLSTIPIISTKKLRSLRSNKIGKKNKHQKASLEYASNSHNFSFELVYYVDAHHRTKSVKTVKMSFK